MREEKGRMRIQVRFCVVKVISFSNRIESRRI